MSNDGVECRAAAQFSARCIADCEAKMEQWSFVHMGAPLHTQGISRDSGELYLPLYGLYIWLAMSTTEGQLRLSTLKTKLESLQCLDICRGGGSLDILDKGQEEQKTFMDVVK